MIKVHFGQTVEWWVALWVLCVVGWLDGWAVG